jgi:hypothetical protein
MRFRISITRREQPAAAIADRAAAVRRFPGSARHGRRALTAVALSAVALVATGVPARAGNSVGVTIGVVPAPVKSVTVSVSSLTYGSCSGGSSTAGQLGFPNATCSTASYIVTNGNAAAQIDVTGADAVPSSGLTHWTLVPNMPGQDQYTEGIVGTTFTLLTNSPQSDRSFGSAAAGYSQSEAAIIGGPSSSTDASPTFTTTITYTAI